MAKTGFRPAGPKSGFKPAGRPKYGAQLLGGLHIPAKSRPNLNVPSKPAAPAKPKPTVTGRHAAPDSLYHSQVNLIDRQEESNLNRLQGAENRVKHDFGLEDPTNPFSRANALKRAYLARYKGVSAGLAAQGHLYSGAHERALERTRFEEERDRAALRQAYEDAIGSIGDKRNSVKFGSEQDRLAAFEDWLSRAPEAEDIAAPAPSAPAPAVPLSRLTGGALAPASATPKTITTPSMAPSGPARTLPTRYTNRASHFALPKANQRRTGGAQAPAKVRQKSKPKAKPVMLGSREATRRIERYMRRNRRG